MLKSFNAILVLSSYTQLPQQNVLAEEGGKPELNGHGANEQE